MSDQKTKVEVTVRPDGLYETKLTHSVEVFQAAIRGFGGQYYQDNDCHVIRQRVADLLVEKYLKENYDKLIQLIDLDTIKMIATRRLAGVVSSTDHKDGGR